MTPIFFGSRLQQRAFERGFRVRLEVTYRNKYPESNRLFLESTALVEAGMSSSADDDGLLRVIFDESKILRINHL